MCEPYLILHKVHGAPAFDIAERNDDMGTPSDPGPWWIIPTSGHRAYPYQWWELDELDVMYIDKYSERWEPVTNCKAIMPDGWPDHYQASQARSRLATAASDILSLMGIGKAKPQAPVKRRSTP